MNLNPWFVHDVSLSAYDSTRVSDQSTLIIDLEFCQLVTMFDNPFASTDDGKMKVEHDLPQF